MILWYCSWLKLRLVEFHMTDMTDRWTGRCKDRPSYKDAHDASSEPSILPLSTICSKILISLVFDESVTNQPTDRWTDQWTDRGTDRPGYRDERTHLETPSFIHFYARSNRPGSRYFIQKNGAIRLLGEHPRSHLNNQMCDWLIDWFRFVWSGSAGDDWWRILTHRRKNKSD